MKRRVRKKSKIEKSIRALFVMSLAFYLVASIGLKAHNMTLSKEEQKVTATLNKNKQEVKQLTSEVNILKEKGRVLGLLDEDVSDNQNNIYVIE